MSANSNTSTARAGQWSGGHAKTPLGSTSMTPLSEPITQMTLYSFELSRITRASAGPREFVLCKSVDWDKAIFEAKVNDDLASSLGFCT